MKIEEAQKIKQDLIENDATIDELALLVNDVTMYCHGAAFASGWWHNKDGSPKDVTNPDFLAAKIALMHSELSEALEGMRKGLQDDHLPHLDMFTVELADTMIRIMDTAGALGLPLGDALGQKLRYNMTREDHKIENRNKVGGKSI